MGTTSTSLFTFTWEADLAYIAILHFVRRADLMTQVNEPSRDVYVDDYVTAIYRILLNDD